MPSLVRPALLLLGVFAVATAIASLAGAKNLGTAMTFGQIAFGIALVAYMLLAPRDRGAAGAGASGDAPDQ